MDTKLQFESQMELWLKQDPLRMEAVHFAAQLNLPQWLLSAGFLRDLVWDRLHDPLNQRPPHNLNDIDLIYFDPSDISVAKEKTYEELLKRWSPHLPWSVKNQARMHIRNQDEPYLSCEHAMSFWPECETAVGVHFNQPDNQFNWVAPFGLASLFNLQLTHNAKRDISLFNARLNQKSWLTRYPKLIIR